MSWNMLSALCTGLDSKDRVSNVLELCALCTGLDSKDRVSNVWNCVPYVQD